MRINKKYFLEQYKDEIENKHNLQASYLFDEYTNKISPYLSLVQEWSAKGISQTRIRLALDVSGQVFKLSKVYFNEFSEAIKNRELVMDLIAQKDLMYAGLLAPAQPKLVEMKLKRYDDEWNSKSKGENEIDIPTTINVEILDKRLPEKKENKKVDKGK